MQAIQITGIIRGVHCRLKCPTTRISAQHHQSVPLAGRSFHFSSFPLHPPSPPLHSSPSSSSPDHDPYAKMEGLWEQHVGTDWLSRLRSSLTPHPVIVVGGDQLTGKSTVTKNLAKALRAEMVSAGRVFRERAAEMGVSVPELSRRAASDPSIDASIDYTLASLTASGSSTGAPLILEGRQPAVIASYCRSRLNKSNLIRLYLTCSLRQQALRFIEREAGLHEAQQADQLLPHHAFTSLNDFVPFIQQLGLPEEMRERVCAAFVDNCRRDEDDRRRYAELYGEAKELNYRDKRLYDAIVDTSLNTPQQTFEQALRAVRALRDTMK